MPYEIGKPFPAQNIWDGQETWWVDFTETFFDIRYYKPDILPHEAQGWSGGKLRCALYKRLHIPFFILDFKNPGSFVVDLNIYDIPTEDGIEQWLNKEGTTINIYLIHAATNIIAARRTISISFGTAEEIRDILERQYQEYSSCSQVENITDSIDLELEKMLERAKMITFKM